MRFVIVCGKGVPSEVLTYLKQSIETGKREIGCCFLCSLDKVGLHSDVEGLTIAEAFLSSSFTAGTTNTSLTISMSYCFCPALWWTALFSIYFSSVVTVQ